MCIAFPGKVIKVDNKKITVQYPQETREALLGGESAEVGDYVLVQMGVVVKTLTPQEYEISKKSWSKA
jgi:hydrogenase maturation factor